MTPRSDGSATRESRGPGKRTTRTVQLVLATLAPGCRRLFTVIGEVATAAVACLTALATGFRSALPIVRKVAGTVLAADMACAGRLLAILGEVARVPGVALLCHWMPLLSVEATGLLGPGV